MDQVDDWLERLIEEKGEDLYRMKGVLSINGSDQRYVFQVLIFFSFVSILWFDEKTFYNFCQI